MSAVIDINHGTLGSLHVPMPGAHSDKEGRGRVLVIGGSASVPGAAVLSGLAALRAGAGKVQLAVPASLATAVGLALIEAGVVGFSETAEGEPASSACSEICALAQSADAVLIGPGMMSASAAQELTHGLLERVIGPLFVIDAMALTGLWDVPDLLARHRGRALITPHAGEMAALTGIEKERVNADRLGVARAAAERLHCTVVAKGAHTYIVEPDGAAYCHAQENIGLATAGSGDVLAGLIAGLAARGSSALAASAWGVYAHAQAGNRLADRIGPLGFLARELLPEIPALLPK